MFWVKLSSIIRDDALGDPELHKMALHRNLVIFLTAIVAKGFAST